jgi:glutamate synthase (NADPH/NADH) small chain
VLEAMGVRFHLGVEIGRDVGFDDLVADHDAVFLGTGTYHYVDGGLPGLGLAGVVPALPYLVTNARRVLETDAQAIAGWAGAVPDIDVAGKHVVVLGGGDTGMDCVRTSVRLGAETVTCVYRRGETDMPGSRREVKNAKDEGVSFLFNRAPLAIEGADGRVQGVRLVETRPGPPDARGRRGQEPIPGTEMLLGADVVIIAFGFQPDPPAWLAHAGIDTGTGGLVAVARGDQPAPAASRLLYQTSNPKVFAGGDNVRGADLVVTAVADGRDAGRAIARWLRG